MQMVFQLTARTVSFTEIADSPELVKRVAELYWNAEKGSTPTSVLLPWFPSPARNLRRAASTEMYNLCKKLYDERMAEGKVYDDAIQILIQEGDEFHQIIDVRLQTFGFNNVFLIHIYVLVRPWILVCWCQ